MASSGPTPTYLLDFDSTLLAVTDSPLDIFADLSEVNFSDSTLYSSFDDVTPLQMADKQSGKSSKKGKKRAVKKVVEEPEQEESENEMYQQHLKRQMELSMQHGLGHGDGPPSAKKRLSKRSQSAAAYDTLEAQMAEKLEEWLPKVSSPQMLAQKLSEKLSTLPDDAPSKLEYQIALRKCSPHFTNTMYTVESNGSFSPSNLQQYHLTDSSWYNNDYDFSSAPFTSYTVSPQLLQQAREHFQHDSSRTVNYLGSYRYSIDSSLLPAEPAIFYTDRLYAYWCRHVNPRNDRHPICFRCQLAYSLPICFIHTSWPCEFCLLNTWEELRKRTNRICKLLNSPNPFESWCTRFHANHKLPVRIHSQLDAYSGKRRANAVMNVTGILNEKYLKPGQGKPESTSGPPAAAAGSAAQAATSPRQPEAVASTSQTTPDRTFRKPTPQKTTVVSPSRSTASTTVSQHELSTAPTAEASVIKQTRKKATRAARSSCNLTKCQKWLINSRNQVKDPPFTYRHSYRKAIYDMVMPNMRYWAKKHKKDTDDPQFDALCLARLTYFENIGDTANWVPPATLPDKKDPLPPTELECIKNLDDAFASTTEDEEPAADVSTMQSLKDVIPLFGDGDDGGDSFGDLNPFETLQDVDPNATLVPDTNTGLNLFKAFDVNNPDTQTAPDTDTVMNTSGLPDLTHAQTSPPHLSPSQGPCTDTQEVTQPPHAQQQAAPSASTGINLKITAVGAGQAGAPLHRVHFLPKWDNVSTLCTGVSVQPFRRMHLRMNELDKAKHPLKLTGMRSGMTGTRAMCQHSEREFWEFEQPMMVEDPEFIMRVRSREREIEEDERRLIKEGGHLAIRASRRLRVNIDDYATQDATVSLNAPYYGPGSNLAGLEPDQRTGRRTIVYNSEMRRLQELARTQGRIAQYMRWVMNTDFAMQIPGELRDCFHTILDDQYKCSGEMIPTLQRIQQRASFVPDTYSAAVAQLHGHSVTESNQVFPR